MQFTYIFVSIRYPAWETRGWLHKIRMP